VLTKKNRFGRNRHQPVCGWCRFCGAGLLFAHKVAVPFSVPCQLKDEYSACYAISTALQSTSTAGVNLATGINGHAIGFNNEERNCN